ncbi:Alpha-catulin [Varanus komodoensis]|nr:Alpha-catulin [Varanus komodoensis]
MNVRSAPVNVRYGSIHLIAGLPFLLLSSTFSGMTVFSREPCLPMMFQKHKSFTGGEGEGRRREGRGGGGGGGEEEEETGAERAAAAAAGAAAASFSSPGGSRAGGRPRRSEPRGSGAMAALPGGSGGGSGGSWPRSPPGATLASALGWEPLSGLQIRSRSVEQTLITTLINHKDKPKRSDKTLRAVQQVGQAVNLAVGRFVMVGEAIANENQELKEEMRVACMEAKQAGETIAQLTDVATLDHPESDGQITIFTDKTGVDLKDEKKKAKMAAARAILEKCTMMLLTASKNKVEGLRDNLSLLSKENLRAMLRVVLEHTEDFTDSAYTSHENRERILQLSKQAKMELEQLQSQKKKDVTEDLEVNILKMCQCMNELQREIISAAETLTLHPSSKIAKENLDVFCEAWESQLSDMLLLLREIRDVFEGRRAFLQKKHSLFLCCLLSFYSLHNVVASSALQLFPESKESLEN